MSSHTPTVLVIEDDSSIRRFIHTALHSEGFCVFEAADGKRGLIEAGTRRPDLLILDLGLPDRDGIEIIRDLRTWLSKPVLVLSARTDETDKVAALDAGADDYLIKPFGVAELLARMRALLRRRHLDITDTPLVQFGEIQMNLTDRTVKKGTQEVHLTSTEYRLLTVLVSNPGKVMTQRQLLKEVWGPSHIDSPHYLRIYMSNLRRKLEHDPTRPEHLLTEGGIGYRLKY